MALADFETATEVLIERFATQWATLHASDCPVAYPNVPFDPSSDYKENLHIGWCRFTINVGDAFPASTSGQQMRLRTVGEIVVQVFVESGTGDRVAAQIADDVFDALTYVVVSGVRLMASRVQPIGQDPGGWYQVNVTTPFLYDILVDMSSEASASFGGWQDPLNLGGTSGLYLWYDATNDKYRAKSGGAPTSESDGAEVAMGA